jgi:hypothetical protein
MTPLLKTNRLSMTPNAMLEDTQLAATLVVEAVGTVVAILIEDVAIVAVVVVVAIPPLLTINGKFGRLLVLLSPKG